MVRRRPAETLTETLAVPVVPRALTQEDLDQIEDDIARQRDEDEERERLHPTILCSCYERIDARHIERHRRSKTHQARFNWFHNYHYNQAIQRLNPVEPIPEPSPEPEDEPEDDNLTDDLISFANREIVAGYPLASCLFYARYCDYAAETYGGSRNPLPFDEVDAILTDAMGLATIDDEYHA
jgi:plasmid stabilization system protein ParE